MTSSFFGTAALLAVLSVGAAAPAHAVGDAGDDRLVDVHPVLTLDPVQVRQFLEPLGVYVPQATRGVDGYRVSYRTVDVRGRRTTASAFVALPHTTDRQLRTAMWLHGTQSFRRDAPSVSECCDRAAGVLFASLGYGTVAPDYLGLGTGPGTHPYFHAATAVSASLDALDATRTLAARHGHVLARRVAVSGFSQGANNALLVANALQRGADTSFSLGALAPISGGYELFDVEWPAALDGRVTAPKSASYYLAYVTVAWNRVYHLYDDESEVFNPPYAGHVAALYDGEHTIDETMAALPDTPAALLRPSYIANLRHPTGRLAAAARTNDIACDRWTPRVPVRMYAAHGDPEAVFDNSVECRKKLAGGDVTLTDVGDVDHITSLIRSIPSVANWFATLP